jgi:methylenetetrahydrofolate dehydrogenase (NADP+)/methenyltetrahydrofolate cyclohydrolase
VAAKIIDGKAIAAGIREGVVRDVAALQASGKAVKLVALLVGDNPAARVYAENQARTCAAVGIDYQLLALPDATSQLGLHDALHRLNNDPAVTGIFLHSPLPPALDLPAAQYQIDVIKDVEGVNPANIGHVVYGHTIIAPCTAQAVVELIESTGVPLRGAEVTVVGASRIVGRPLALLLTEREATVTLCHIHTRDTPAACRRADVVVVAVGKPALVKGCDIKPGAVVIDVGINRVKIDGADKTVGDVAFDDAAQHAGFITPVPGGVGPVTVAMLLRNTLRAAKLVHRLEQPFAGH